VAAARELKPSLRYIEPRCQFTVRELMKSSLATSELVIRLATSLNTSTSRALRPAGNACGVSSAA
jgi:hypothetical protein